VWKSTPIRGGQYLAARYMLRVGTDRICTVAGLRGVNRILFDVRILSRIPNPTQDHCINTQQVLLTWESSYRNDEDF
jgi:hypothetical protein